MDSGLNWVIEHSGIWIDLKSILALIFLICVIVFFAVRAHKMRNREKELENQMSEKKDDLS